MYFDNVTLIGIIAMVTVAVVLVLLCRAVNCTEFD